MMVLIVLCSWFILGVLEVFCGEKFENLINCVGLVWWIVLLISFWWLDDKFKNKKANKFSIQFETLELPETMEKIYSNKSYGEFFNNKGYTDFMASMLIKTDMSEDEIYKWFSKQSYKSINKVFKTKPEIMVHRVDEISHTCGNGVTDEVYVLSSEKVTEKKYYTVMLVDKAEA